MLKLKNCPRCRGDMHSNRDLYGPYSECLQCGHMQYGDAAPVARTRERRGAKRTAAA